MTPRTQQAVRLYQDGKSLPAIADEMGVKVRWLQLLLKNAGIRRRRGRPRQRSPFFAGTSRSMF